MSSTKERGPRKLWTDGGDILVSCRTETRTQAPKLLSQDSLFLYNLCTESRDTQFYSNLYVHFGWLSFRKHHHRIGVIWPCKYSAMWISPLPVLWGNYFYSAQKVLLIATMKPIRELLIVPVGEHVFAIKSNEVSRKSQLECLSANQISSFSLFYKMKCCCYITLNVMDKEWLFVWPPFFLEALIFWKINSTWCFIYFDCF